MVRTRFAPSPTGYLHIGGLRTALYAYLYAKKHDGVFYLRSEDTDRTRLVEWAEDSMIEGLSRLGLEPMESPKHGGDFGPYRQSDRLEIYQKHVQTLIDAGHAYYCFCSAKRLEDLRTQQQELKLPPKYDGHCRHMTPDEIQEKLDAGVPYTIRLKVPKNETITFYDEVKGKIEVPSNDVDDQVLMKTDGFPTYHLAAVVDDHLMKTTHVIRGDEWVASTPKHVLLYKMFGWEAPKWVHIPVILGTDKKKLSKRTGDTKVTQYIEKGFLTEALINYIALLGWNPKTTEEFFSMDELTQKFTLEGVQKSGAVFDVEKLTWMNARYIMETPVEELYTHLDIYLQTYHSDFYTKDFSRVDKEYNMLLIAELHRRLKTLADFPVLTSFFYSEANIRTDLLIKEKMKINTLEDAKGFLELGRDILDLINDSMSLEEVKSTFIEKIKEADKKNGQILWPIRVALSGEEFSPGALELIHILGTKTSRERITKLLEAI